MNKLNFIWALPALLLLSIVVGALGGDTVHYQCKYVDSVEVKVADHEKYADAAYAIHYSDGTVGADTTLGSNAPLGLDRGAVCKTIFEWGFPYSATNRNIADESSVKETK